MQDARNSEPVNKVVYLIHPLFAGFFYIPGGPGFLPSTVSGLNQRLPSPLKPMKGSRTNLAIEFLEVF